VGEDVEGDGVDSVVLEGFKWDWVLWYQWFATCRFADRVVLARLERENRVELGPVDGVERTKLSAETLFVRRRRLPSEPRPAQSARQHRHIHASAHGALHHRAQRATADLRSTRPPPPVSPQPSLLHPSQCYARPPTASRSVNRL
jgi:hypothetical protein